MKASLALASLAWLAVASSALALECPTPAAIDDAASAAAVAKVLPGGVDLEAPDALETAVFQLREAGVADGVIVDNLISTYCNALNAKPDLVEADKTQRVEAFSKTATRAVFGGGD